jgi:hypothetical protein
VVVAVVLVVVPVVTELLVNDVDVWVVEDSVDVVPVDRCDRTLVQASVPGPAASSSSMLLVQYLQAQLKHL